MAKVNNFFAGSGWLKLLSIGALIFLAICVVSGLFVVSGGVLMLGRKNYNLEYRFIKSPGLINVFSFFFGFAFLAVNYHKQMNRS